MQLKYTHKKIYAVYAEGAVTDWTCQKWFVKFSWYYRHFGEIILCCGTILCIGGCLAAPLASADEKPIEGDSWRIQNIQINEVIGENEKCVFYFMGKTKQTFWPTQYNTLREIEGEQEEIFQKWIKDKIYLRESVKYWSYAKKI